MTFEFGTNAINPTQDNIKKQQKNIACECWFTKSGKITPLMFKYEDDDGEIHTVRDIQVIKVEKKNYSGIPSLEYRCKILLSGFQLEVCLVYYIENNNWVILY